MPTQMINAQRAHAWDASNGGDSLRQRAVDMLERVGIPRRRRQDLGSIVEIGSSDDIFDEPRHPYTRALLASIPDPHAARETATVGAAVAGEIPSPRNPPSGCRFRPRCPFAEQRCAEEVPTRSSALNAGERVRPPAGSWRP